MMRWNFPPPPNLRTAPVTNMRNLKSPYWRGWLKAEWHCFAPATSFCEWKDSRPKTALNAVN
jgi:putative SOS response-associated peptidase YedK